MNLNLIISRSSKEIYPHVLFKETPELIEEFSERILNISKADNSWFKEVSRILFSSKKIKVNKSFINNSVSEFNINFLMKIYEFIFKPEYSQQAYKIFQVFIDNPASYTKKDIIQCVHINSSFLRKKIKISDKKEYLKQIKQKSLQLKIFYSHVLYEQVYWAKKPSYDGLMFYQRAVPFISTAAEVAAIGCLLNCDPDLSFLSGGENERCID